MNYPTLLIRHIILPAWSERCGAILAAIVALSFIADRATGGIWSKNVRQDYSGPVVLGEDLTRIEV
ncbi:hypothetical protein ACRQ5Q_33050 [Bradyrhizobium sp. PMVTL-01]|uniref:hypothetical protein n=1 Tax=Bradyrhizobium sp. PMVTL-01 TaxID=3434999 RepID=UPI003F6F61DB